MCKAGEAWGPLRSVWRAEVVNCSVGRVWFMKSENVIGKGGGSICSSISRQVKWPMVGVQVKARGHVVNDVRVI